MARWALRKGPRLGGVDVRLDGVGHASHQDVLIPLM